MTDTVTYVAMCRVVKVWIKQLITYLHLIYIDSSLWSNSAKTINLNSENIIFHVKIEHHICYSTLKLILPMCNMDRGIFF